MNLERLARDTVDFRQATIERAAQWEVEAKFIRERMTHLDEKVDSLADSVRMLVTAAQAQQVRIERLERKTG
jgi:hypothetical protein